jgi:hypothetical protein
MKILENAEVSLWRHLLDKVNVGVVGYHLVEHTIIRTHQMNRLNLERARSTPSWCKEQQGARKTAGSQPTIKAAEDPTAESPERMDVLECLTARILV